jgi:electron transfer flavoprotein beta subunit
MYLPYLSRVKKCNLYFIYTTLNMKIAVLIKQVPGSESSLPINASANWLDENGITYVMNESDSYAIEEALQISEKNEDAEVVVISMGPERIKKVLREALAKGAHRAIHVSTQESETTDPLSTAKTLAENLKDENFDLVFSGLQSDDLGFGQTGIILGELLNMSTATLAMSTELNGDKIRVKRELEAGFFQWVTMSLPACISVQSGCNTPRYPSLKGIMGAKKKEIKECSVSLIDQQQSIQKIYTPKSSKETLMIEGSADDVAAKLVDILKNEIKIS